MPVSRALCAYKGCRNSKYKNPDVTFHRFPTDDARQAEWILRSGNEKLYDLTPKQITSKRICSDHFTNQDNKWIDSSGARKLKCNVNPIEYFAKTNSSEVDIEIDAPLMNNLKENVINFQISEPQLNELSSFKKNDSISGKNLSDEILKLHEQLKEKEKAVKIAQCAIQNALDEKEKSKEKYRNLQRVLKQKNKTIKLLQAKVTKNEEDKIFIKNYNKLHENVKTIIRMQVEHIKRKPWSLNEKQFALRLFFTSSKAYRFLRNKQNFALPCITKIRQWANQMDLGPGNIDNLLPLPETNAEETEIESILIEDEMSIQL